MIPAPVLFALALIAAPPRVDLPRPPTAAVVEEAPEVAELVVTARRRPRTSPGTTVECLWARLDPDARDGLVRGVDQARRAGQAALMRRTTDIPLQEPAVANALTSCGAGTDPALTPYGKAALQFYALEQNEARFLASRRIGGAELARAWERLSASDRERLADFALQAYAEGATDETAASMVPMVFAMIRRLRPVSAFNPFFYRGDSTAKWIVSYALARALRQGVERGFSGGQAVDGAVPSQVEPPIIGRP